MSMVGCICKVALVASIIGSAASAQMFTAGVRGGASWGPGQVENFTVGPTVEFKPPIIPVRIVADALYKRIQVTDFTDEVTLTDPAGGTHIGYRTKGKAVWDFPIMARVELPTPILRPFIGAGPTFRYIPVFPSDNWQKGAVIGAGVRINAFALKFTPEVRFSHFRASGPRGVDNQGEFLLGITF